MIQGCSLEQAKTEKPLKNCILTTRRLACRSRRAVEGRALGRLTQCALLPFARTCAAEAFSSAAVGIFSSNSVKNKTRDTDSQSLRIKRIQAKRQTKTNSFTNHETRENSARDHHYAVPVLWVWRMMYRSEDTYAGFFKNDGKCEPFSTTHHKASVGKTLYVWYM